MSENNFSYGMTVKPYPPYNVSTDLEDTIPEHIAGIRAVADVNDRVDSVIENAKSIVGNATTDTVGVVKVGDGLNVTTDGDISFSESDSIYVDPVDNKVKINMSNADKGVLPISRGGTGGGSKKAAYDSLGLTAEFDSIKEHISGMPLRNAVLAGKSVGGYPNYLTWMHVVDLQHDDKVYTSVHGTVSASEDGGTNYTAVKPLYNSVIYHNYNWEPASGTHAAWWQYKFSDYEPDHIMIGMYLQNFNSEPNAWPKKWQLLGRNTEEEEWTTILDIDDDPPLCGFADCKKEHGRQYWFTDNTTAYKILRINIESNHNPDGTNGTVCQFSAIRFYETFVPGIEKYDTYLYASEKEPFIGTIACGMKEDIAGVLRPCDKTVKLTESVRLRRDGTIPYAEMSDNFIYMAPYDIAFDSNDELTDVYKKCFPRDRELLAFDKEKNYVIFSSTKRIQYGTPDSIAKNCVFMLQCDTDEDIAASDTASIAYTEMSPWCWQIKVDKVKFDTSEKYRGSNSSYLIEGDGSTANVEAYICTNNDEELYNQFPYNKTHVYNQEFTLELDFKYTGNKSSTANDTIQMICLFDGGYGASTSNKGWKINYIKPRKQLEFCFGRSSTHYISMPVNIEDGEWHTLCLSVNGSANIAYWHYDGKFMTACQLGTRFDAYANNYFGLGRAMGAANPSFTGWMNNVRYVLDNCLYQGDDYEVRSTFDLSPVPDGTLWWDHSIGVMKIFDYDSNSWQEIPLLPLGVVWTGRKENLLTDQPFGVGRVKSNNDEYTGMKWIKFDGWSCDNQNNATTNRGKNIFNFSESGTNPWISGNNANVANIDFTTTEPLQFERVFLVQANTNAYRQPTFFKLFGKNQKDENWTLLLDKSEFEDIGGFNATITAIVDYEWPSYLAFDFEQTVPYDQYRLQFPPKTDIPWYSLDNYRSIRACLQFKGAKPEIKSITSSMIGAYWEMPTSQVINNQQYVYTLPCDNLCTDYVGYIEETIDHMYKKRPIPQVSYIASGDCRGEVTYKSRNKLYISTGSSNLTTFANSQNWDEVSGNSTRGNLYVTIRRMY